MRGRPGVGGLAVGEGLDEGERVEGRQAPDGGLPAPVFDHDQHAAPACCKAEHAAGHLQGIAQAALGGAEQPARQAVGGNVLYAGEQGDQQTAGDEGGQRQGLLR